MNERSDEISKDVRKVSAMMRYVLVMLIFGIHIIKPSLRVDNVLVYPNISITLHVMNNILCTIILFDAIGGCVLLENVLSGKYTASEFIYVKTIMKKMFCKK